MYDPNSNVLTYASVAYKVSQCIIIMIPFIFFSGQCQGGGKVIDSLTTSSGNYLNVFKDIQFGCGGPVTKWMFYAEVGGQ